ncbi:hypothetical protein PVAG01_09802 [Phlyctema vagabunda]|uniref:Uncharacterized protein n=1 Tax=Phlyctema vagabunda TaxID=108571 RepID=A0ABR4P4G9_9HELO
MATTRLSTHTITRRKYDWKTLQDQGTIPSVEFSKIIISPRRKWFKKQAARNRKSKSPRSPPVGVRELLATLGKQKVEDVSPDLNEGRPNIIPKTVFGEFEVTGKSKIQRADRLIEQWEEVRRAHAEQDSEALPFIDFKLEEARAERASLEDNEENNQVGVKDIAGYRIAERLKVLEWGLSTSNCTVEKENITAVIDGYKSGAIPFSDRLTIVYAGKIVDQAADYAEYLADRQERLDRYAAQYGQGWLFYEEPLDVHPESRAIMCRSATYNRPTFWHNLASWEIFQSIEKRTSWVARLDIPYRVEPPEFSNFRYDTPSGTWWAGSSGPSLTFRMLLDSGATYPSISKKDFLNLGIDDRVYPCQTLTLLDTASELGKPARLYEMFVRVLDEGCNSLVDENNAVWPSQPKYLGGLCPVARMGDVGDLHEMDPATGISYQQRLSGMLPFLSCYVQVTPNRNDLFLGEDRRHVLGAHRIPGQRRWDLTLGSKATQPTFNRAIWDDPVTRFTHRGGEVIDEDEANSHGSITIAMKGTASETIVTNHPGRETAKRVEELRLRGELFSRKFQP